MFVDVIRYSQRYFDETIKAAEVILVVNTRLNTTRTVTSLIDLPSGYTRPEVDRAGSAVYTVTTDQYNGTTVMYVLGGSMQECVLTDIVAALFPRSTPDTRPHTRGMVLLEPLLARLVPFAKSLERVVMS